VPAEEFFRATEDLVVLYDDLDLPFGRIRIRRAAMRAVTAACCPFIERLAGAPFIGSEWALAGRQQNGRRSIIFGTFQRSRIGPIGSGRRPRG